MILKVSPAFVKALKEWQDAARATAGNVLPDPIDTQAHEWQRRGNPGSFAACSATLFMMLKHIDVNPDLSLDNPDPSL